MANVIKASAWHYGPLGCFVTFDTLEQAETVRNDQPTDPNVGLTSDFWTVTKTKNGYEVRVMFQLMDHYLSERDWLSIS